ncbi:MAG: hypothetical protein JXA74_07620 [Anaerolineae bacterium]|nr:hypothetical protein [Anaerolineae bacterium]
MRTGQARLVIILLFAVLARIVAALYYGDIVEAPPLLLDQLSYHALAERLLAGHGYSFALGWYPFTPRETLTAHWSFLYPLFVAGLYAVFGIHPLAARLSQAIVGGVLLPWMIYRLAKRLFPDRPSIWLVAAAIAAGYAYFIFYAAALMTETFYLILLLWSLEIAIGIDEQLQSEGLVRPLDALLLGLSLGLGTLMRQSLLPWVPLLCAWFLWRGWRAGRLSLVLKRLLLMSVIIILCILPWTVRNYAAYGEFLLLNSNTGYAMYSAQHPMHGVHFQEFAAAPMPPGLEGLNEAQLDRELLRRGLRFVLEEPGRYLRLCLSRARAYFEIWPTADAPLLHNLGRMASIGLFLPFMLWGVLLYFKRAKDNNVAYLPFIFILFYSILHILTWAMVRYRLPIDAILVPFAALALVTTWQLLRQRYRARDRTESISSPSIASQHVRQTG